MQNYGNEQEKEELPFVFITLFFEIMIPQLLKNILMRNRVRVYVTSAQG